MFVYIFEKRSDDGWLGVNDLSIRIEENDKKTLNFFVIKQE